MSDGETLPLSHRTLATSRPSVLRHHHTLTAPHHAPTHANIHTTIKNKPPTVNTTTATTTTITIKNNDHKERISLKSPLISSVIFSTTTITDNNNNVNNCKVMSYPPAAADRM